MFGRSPQLILGCAHVAEAPVGVGVDPVRDRGELAVVANDELAQVVEVVARLEVAVRKLDAEVAGFSGDLGADEIRRAVLPVK